MRLAYRKLLKQTMLQIHLDNKLYIFQTIIIRTVPKIKTPNDRNADSPMIDLNIDINLN